MIAVISETVRNKHRDGNNQKFNQNLFLLVNA